MTTLISSLALPHRQLAAYASGALGLCLACSSPVSFGAQETEVVPFLHGEVSAGLSGTSARGKFYQAGIDVGTLREGERGPSFGLRFGVLPGLEVFGQIPLVQQGSRTYSEVSAMCGDSQHPPESGGFESDCVRGTMYQLNSSLGIYQPAPVASNLPEWAYSGLGNVAIGLRYSPLHEADLGSLDKTRTPLQKAFPSQVTWRLELGLLLNTGDSFYNGGAASGGTGVQLGTSFSRRINSLDPYLSFLHQRFGTYLQPATDSQGQSEVLELKTPNETDLHIGLEVVPYEDRASGARFAVDFAGGVRVLSDSTVVSGSRLPVIVTTTEEANGTDGESTREEEQIGVEARLRMHYQLFKYLRLDAGGAITYVMPHRLEQGYAVMLGSHAEARLGASLAVTY